MKLKPAFPYPLRNAKVIIRAADKNHEAKGSQVFLEDDDSYVIVAPASASGVTTNTRVRAHAVQCMTVTPPAPAPKSAPPLPPFYPFAYALAASALTGR